MNLFDWLNRQRRWSRETFPHQTWGSNLAHMEKEVVEVRKSPSDVEEWADVVILAFGGAMAAGHTPHDICVALQRKQTKNMNRKWGKPDTDGVSYHVKAEVSVVERWNKLADESLEAPDSAIEVSHKSLGV